MWVGHHVPGVSKAEGTGQVTHNSPCSSKAPGLQSGTGNGGVREGERLSKLNFSKAEFTHEKIFLFQV